MSNNKDNNGNKNGFTGAVRSMFDGIDHVVSSKTVVGDPIYVDGMTLIPLMEVSFAMGTGVLAQDSRGKKSGGVGAKMIPRSHPITEDEISETLDRVLEDGEDVIEE